MSVSQVARKSRLEPTTSVDDGARCAKRIELVPELLERALLIAAGHRIAGDARAHAKALDPHVQSLDLRRADPHARPLAHDAEHVVDRDDPLAEILAHLTRPRSALRACSCDRAG